MGLDFADDGQIAIDKFKDSFVYFYIHYVENEYFELDLDTLDAESNSWLLQNEFKTEKIKPPQTVANLYFDVPWPFSPFVFCMKYKCYFETCRILAASYKQMVATLPFLDFTGKQRESSIYSSVPI